MNIKILAAIAIISVMIFGYLLFNYISIFKTVELEMHLQVNNYTGFNIDTDKIYFGTIPPNGSGKRNISIENSENFPLKALILTGGELAHWVSTTENNFIVKPGQTKEITLVVKVPENAKYGNYTGIVKVILKKIYI